MAGMTVAEAARANALASRGKAVPVDPRERRSPVYEEAPGFPPGWPRVMTRAQARGDRAVLSIVTFPLATFCPRQPLVRALTPG